MVGQKEMFFEIWDERPKVCTICYNPLGNEPNAWFFSHTIGKGAYPAFKLRKKNIDLMCANCHHLYDHSTHVAKTIANFGWVFKKAERLKQQYNWYIRNRLLVDSRLKHQ